MTVGDADRDRRFDALFKDYLADMVAYCSWRARSGADAEDAVSEVFLTVWRRLDEVPNGQEARLWLYGIARRVLANQTRGGRRRALLQVRLNSVPNQTFEEDQYPYHEVDPSLTEAVRGALHALKSDDREVLLLAEWEGLTPTQIATVVGCPVVTARGRLFRARRRFRAQLDEAGVEARAHGAVVRLPGASAPECAVDSPGALVSR